MVFWTKYNQIEMTDSCDQSMHNYKTIIFNLKYLFADINKK